MAIPSYDAASGSATSGASSSLTWSHTVGSGILRRLDVWVYPSGGTGVVTGVTYGGKALTQLAEASRMTHWALLAPASGAANIVVSLSSNRHIAACAISTQDTSQTDLRPAVWNVNADTSPTTTAPSAGTDLVIAGFGWLSNSITLTSGSGQTRRNTQAASSSVSCAVETEPGAAPSVVMDGTLSGSVNWSVMAVSLQPESYRRTLMGVGR